MIADELNKLKQTKALIKLALIDKGQNPTDEFATYAVEIGNITIGGGGDPFLLLGYPMPEYIRSSIDYSKTILDNWDGVSTFQGNANLEFMPFVDTSNITDASNMFQTCHRLLYVPKFDMPNLTKTLNMFLYCNGLLSVDVSGYNTSKVTDMSSMFESCIELKTLDVSHFNTSNVTNMYRMFSSCNNLLNLDLTNWNTENVTNMSWMFAHCDKFTTLDISNWNKSKVLNISYMFNGLDNLVELNISNWDMSNITNVYYFCYSCSKLKIVRMNNCDTSKITNMGYMFSSSSSLDKIEGIIDWSGLNSVPTLFLNGVHNFTIRNIGKLGTSFNFNSYHYMYWGDESDSSTYPYRAGARQSLVDSLVNYTYDRVSNGMETCTLTLYSTMKQILTEEEIALITAKGYTIA